MEMSGQEELKAHLMASNDEFKRLAEEHASCHARLEAIEAKAGFAPVDEEEEHRLKKVKLRLKDEMNAMLARSREVLA